MNIDSLKYFYMIAKEGSISNVAKEVHLTQSALSQQIQKLENDLSKKLLTRSNKGVELTKAGRIVYKFAGNILRTYDKMMDEISAADQENRSIKIEACDSIASYALPCTLIKANQIYPNHSYELLANASAEIINNVTNNICDIGFACDSQIDENLGSGKDIVASKVGVSNIVLAAKNEDCYPDTITARDLLDMCLITFTGKNNITNSLIRNLKRLGYDQSSINCNLRVEGIESAKILISKNYGIAFMPYIAVKEELYKKLFKVIEIPEFDMDLDITLLHKRNCSIHAKDFVEWFKKDGNKSFC